MVHVRLSLSSDPDQGGGLASFVPIVLQKSKVAAVQIFGENLAPAALRKFASPAERLLQQYRGQSRPRNF
jgi:hypothetical protein